MDEKIQQLVEIARQRGWAPGVQGSIPDLIFGNGLSFLKSLYMSGSEDNAPHLYHVGKLAKMVTEEERVGYLSAKFLNAKN